MARTAAFSLALGALIAWNWGRLEEPHVNSGQFLLMVVLAVAPALLPEWRLRLGAGAVAFFLAAAYALDARPYELPRIAGRAGGGFLDYYDVLVPFDPHAHELMHGALLLAVFLFTFAAALAVAARRPLAASLFLVAGAGWPATIMPGADDLGRGAFILGASLALIAWLDPEARRAPPQILVGTGLVILALIAS